MPRPCQTRPERTRKWGWAGRAGLKKSQGCVSSTRWRQAAQEWLENRRAGTPATARGLVPSCPPGVHQHRQMVSVFSQQLEGMCEGLGPGPGARMRRRWGEPGAATPPRTLARRRAGGGGKIGRSKPRERCRGGPSSPEASCSLLSILGAWAEGVTGQGNPERGVLRQHGTLCPTGWGGR